MKYILVIILLVAAWNQLTSSKKKDFAKPEPTPVVIKQNFECDGRQHCSQMKSYEEAVFFNNNCPDTKMDGDNDGMPCERQFNRF